MTPSPRRNHRNQDEAICFPTPRCQNSRVFNGIVIISKGAIIPHGTVI
jgi:hypothetical protein